MSYEEELKAIPEKLMTPKEYRKFYVGYAQLLKAYEIVKKERDDLRKKL